MQARLPFARASAKFGARVVPVGEGAEELPVTLSADIGTLRMGGGDAPLRAPRLGGELGATRSLPLGNRCANFWKLQGKLELRAPLTCLSPPALRVPRIPLARFRRKGAVRLVKQEMDVEIADPLSLLAASPPPSAKSASPPLSVTISRLADSIEDSIRNGRLVVRTHVERTSRVLPAYEEVRLGGPAGDGALRGYDDGELGAGHYSVRGTAEVRLPVPRREPQAIPVAQAVPVHRHRHHPLRLMCFCSRLR